MSPWSVPDYVQPTAAHHFEPRIHTPSIIRRVLGRFFTPHGERSDTRGENTPETGSDSADRNQVDRLCRGICPPQKKICDKRLKSQNTGLKQENNCLLVVFLQGVFLVCILVRPVPEKAVGIPIIDVI